MEKPIFVTESSLPPLEEFIPYLEKIWAAKVLTNGGQFHQELEKELVKFLNVECISLFNNGTNALLTAVQALELSGEVITTPYSFVATSHAIVWNNLTPVFVDIDPETFNIDPLRIEEAITPKTSAILAVHCYGNPCDVERIEKIAKKHNLKVIYDAAHAFGVTYKGRSILSYGDLSILSFHATKVFNTFEGGAIVSNTPQMKEKIDRLKNFGIVSEVQVGDFGTNGKMSEVNSAFGLCQLKYIEQNIMKRKSASDFYDSALMSVQNIKTLKFKQEVQPNFSYYPVLISEQSHNSRDVVFELMKEEGVFARRYFYPLITDFSVYKSHQHLKEHRLERAKNISNGVLCLPMFSEITIEQQRKIIFLLTRLVK